MRFPNPLRPGSLLRGSAIALLFAAPAVRAQGSIGSLDSMGDRRLDAAVSLQYAFGRAGDWDLIPAVSLGGGTGLWSDPVELHRLFVHYGMEAGGTGQPGNRVDFARSLLLPGALSARLGVGLATAGSGPTRAVFPEVSIGAKVVPWRDDTTAIHVGLSGGLGFSSGDVFDASILITRAVNAFGVRDRRMVLAASGGPDLWSSDLAATAGLHDRGGDLGIFGSFGAYLFDSKFHVPPDGRRVFTLGIRKTFG